MPDQVINRPILVNKQEWKRGEFKGVKIDLPPTVGTVQLVACPARDYQPASTEDCRECPFWYGFAPLKQNGGGPSPVISLCGHPIGRSIAEVKI